jgi:hypothetical protein
MAQVNVFSLGGVGAPCCCSPSFVCPTTICTKCCVNHTPISGLTITVKSAGTTIATGTTGDDGCVTLEINTAGTYTVVIADGSGTLLGHTGLYALACHGTTTIIVEDVICCIGSKDDLNWSVVGTIRVTPFGTCAINLSGTVPYSTGTPVCPFSSSYNSNGDRWVHDINGSAPPFPLFCFGTHNASLIICRNCQFGWILDGVCCTNFGDVTGTCDPFEAQITIPDTGVDGFFGTITWTS